MHIVTLKTVKQISLSSGSASFSSAFRHRRLVRIASDETAQGTKEFVPLLQPPLELVVMGGNQHDNSDRRLY